jgi:hypothetical protein
MTDSKREISALNNANSALALHTTELDTYCGTLSKRIDSADEFRNQILSLLYFDSLVHNMDAIIDGAEDLRAMYGPLVPVVRAPFSHWRPSRPVHEMKSQSLLTDDVLDGEMWARSVERHVEEVQLLMRDYNDDLVTVVKAWHTIDVTYYGGDSLFRLLREHQHRLSEIRNYYAATGRSLLDDNPAISARVQA